VELGGHHWQWVACDSLELVVPDPATQNGNLQAITFLVLVTTFMYRDLAPEIAWDQNRPLNAGIRASIRRRTSDFGSPLCQETVGASVLSWGSAGPGSD
jgi:hypothetical protein